MNMRDFVVLTMACLAGSAVTGAAALNALRPGPAKTAVATAIAPAMQAAPESPPRSLPPLVTPPSAAVAEPALAALPPLHAAVTEPARHAVRRTAHVRHVHAVLPRLRLGHAVHTPQPPTRTIYDRYVYHPYYGYVRAD